MKLIHCQLLHNPRDSTEVRTLGFMFTYFDHERFHASCKEISLRMGKKMNGCYYTHTHSGIKLIK